MVIALYVHDFNIKKVIFFWGGGGGGQILVLSTS